MSRKFVGFTLDRVRYGIPVDTVVQIIRDEHVIPVPTGPLFVAGVLNLRGEVIPIVDLRHRFGLAAAKEIKKRRIIVVRIDERNYGLLVDSVREILDIEDERVSTEATSLFGIKLEFVLGYAKVEDELLVLLDIAKVLTVPYNR
jgi:purine-binding chemotaxis protein CheW